MIRARWRAAVPLERATAWRRADMLGQLPFELVDVRAERGDPIRVERLEQRGALVVTDIGR